MAPTQSSELGLAYEFGYSDQAHFIHEFNYYMGVSPNAYLARHQPIMAGAWKNRKALLGSPVQVLQPPQNPKA